MSLLLPFLKKRKIFGDMVFVNDDYNVFWPEVQWQASVLLQQGQTREGRREGLYNSGWFLFSVNLNRCMCMCVSERRFDFRFQFLSFFQRQFWIRSVLKDFDRVWCVIYIIHRKHTLSKSSLLTKWGVRQGKPITKFSLSGKLVSSLGNSFDCWAFFLKVSFDC